MPLLTFIVEDEVVPISTAWGLPVKKVRIQSALHAFEPNVPKLHDELGGHDCVEQYLIKKQPYRILIS